MKPVVSDGENRGTHRFREELRKAKERAGISYFDLSLELGFNSQNGAYHLLTNETAWLPKPEVFRRACEFFGLDPVELLVVSGYINQEEIER